MNIDKVRKLVYKLIDNENSGHGSDHVNRVLKLSLKFAKLEKANEEIVALVALLHDVDDYKIVGLDNSMNLSNALAIMNEVGVDNDTANRVAADIKSIGYSKRLKGIVPTTLEAKIVSDADMCDAIGANGILRAYRYSISKNQPFFDSKVYPINEISFEAYTTHCSTSVCHMFEKLLKLKGMMLTNAGKNESTKRHRIIVDFLYQLFDEENTFEWKEMLRNYLAKL